MLFWADALLDQVEPGPHQVPGPALRRRDHVGARDQVGPEQQGQGVGVDLVRLHFRRGDRLEAGGVSQHHLDAEGAQQIGQPVPGTGRLDDGLVRARELGEVRLEGERRARHPALFDARALGAVGCQHGELFVLVDAGVPHRSALLG